MTTYTLQRTLLVTCTTLITWVHSFNILFPLLLFLIVSHTTEEDGSDDDEFGFYEGEEYTLSKFEKKARNFSEKWFPSRPTAEQVEEEFWRIVETAEDSVKVRTLRGRRERRSTSERLKEREKEYRQEGRLTGGGL
jgi:hypothetical protein